MSLDVTSTSTYSFVWLSTRETCVLHLVVDAISTSSTIIKYIENNLLLMVRNRNHVAAVHFFGLQC